MIRIVYDANVTDKLAGQIVKKESIVRDIKRKIVDYLVGNNLMASDKANAEVEVISGINDFSITIGGLNSGNSLIQTDTEANFFGETNAENFLFKTMKANDDFKERKKEIKNILEEVVSESILSKEL
jgi:hypothetical protein